MPGGRGRGCGRGAVGGGVRLAHNPPTSFLPLPPTRPVRVAPLQKCDTGCPSVDAAGNTHCAGVDSAKGKCYAYDRTSFGPGDTVNICVSCTDNAGECAGWDWDWGCGGRGGRGRRGMSLRHIAHAHAALGAPPPPRTALASAFAADCSTSGEVCLQKQVRLLGLPPPAAPAARLPTPARASCGLLHACVSLARVALTPRPPPPRAPPRHCDCRNAAWTRAARRRPRQVPPPIPAPRGSLAPRPSARRGRTVALRAAAAWRACRAPVRWWPRDARAACVPLAAAAACIACLAPCLQQQRWHTATPA